MSTALATAMPTPTCERPVELVLSLDDDVAPALEPAVWLPAAVEALQIFRDHD